MINEWNFSHNVLSRKIYLQLDLKWLRLYRRLWWVYIRVHIQTSSVKSAECNFRYYLATSKLNIPVIFVKLTQFMHGRIFWNAWRCQYSVYTIWHQLPTRPHQTKLLSIIPQPNRRKMFDATRIHVCLCFILTIFICGCLMWLTRGVCVLFWSAMWFYRFACVTKTK